MWKWFSRLVFLSVLMLSCASPKPKPEPILVKDFIGAAQNGMYREASIGDTPKEVRESLKDSTVFSADTLIRSSAVINKGNLRFSITTYYSFDVYGLFEIQADMFAPTDSAALLLANLISEELNSRYGEHTQLGTTKRWTTVSRRNNIIEISLSNESIDFGEPFISLNYLEPMDDKI